MAAISAEPDDAAEQVTQALLHEPLTIVESRAEWTRIVTAYDYPGWIRNAQLEAGEGALPPASMASPLEVALTFLGAPYEWGGLTRRGIDCSGLVHIAHRLTGTLIPRDAWQQEGIGVPVEPGDEREGDLVTFGDTPFGSGRADHIAFLLGDGRILHATGRDGLGVVLEDEPEAIVARRRAVVRRRG